MEFGVPAVRVRMIQRRIRLVEIAGHVLRIVTFHMLGDIQIV